ESIKGLGHLINGEIVRGSKTFPVDNPSTGKVVAKCPDATLKHLDQAMAAAEAAQPAWAAAPEQTRRDAILAMANALTEHFADNILNGNKELEAKLHTHPNTLIITFTGSVATGKHIAAAAGAGMKNFVCELGGHDPAIVLDDVDVQAVARKFFGSAMGGTGQI